MKTIEIGMNHLPKLNQPLALATGYFDGFHIGHQSLVNEAKRIAEDKGYASAVLSFHPNPLVTLGKMKEEKYLSSLEDRKQILEKLGVDYFLILDFTKEVACMEPSDFVQKFIIEMNVKAVICGFDFYFGNKGKGNGDFLKQYPNDFEVSIIEQVAMDHLKISSTRINQLLQDGEIEKANTLLTRPYHVNGPVIKGKQRGRLMGFPTANVEYGAYYLPGFGVYGVKVKVDDKEYPGMCNIGLNPTFNDLSHPSMEVNIFNFNQDIYGKNIDVYFYCFIREEKTFASKEALMQQLKLDQIKIMQYFNPEA